MPSDDLIEFLTLMIGAAVIPAWVIIVLLFLRGQDGLRQALAFVGGTTLVRLMQGLFFGMTLEYSPAAQTEQGSNLIVSTLLLVLGILLWITVTVKWFKQPDPDEPAPKWMTAFGSVSAGKAFLLGILLMALGVKQWVFTLSALGVIRHADLSNSQSIIAYLGFVIGAQLFMFIPIIARILAPASAAQFIEAGSQWLERHNRSIAIGVSAVFGTYFVLKGIVGLMGG